jgi:hypothetical protein
MKSSTVTGKMLDPLLSRPLIGVTGAGGRKREFLSVTSQG